MTTFFLPLASSSLASIELFDVALVDGSLEAIEHNISVVGTTSENGSLAYELELTFPAFERSLFYDPSLNLGVLVSGGKSGGSDNTALVVAVAVVVPSVVIGAHLAGRGRDGGWLVGQTQACPSRKWAGPL